MNKSTIHLSQYGTDLSSRLAAAKARLSVLALLQAGNERVVVDCAGIRVMSESFADELFGILVATRGKAWFKEHIQVSGLTEGVREAILQAVDARLSVTPAA